MIGGTVFAAGDGPVFRTTDDGTSWTEVSSGMSHPYVRCLATAGPALFAGTSMGYVYVTTDNGSHWSDVSTGLSSVQTSTLAATGTHLYAGSFSQGIWRRPIVEMILSAHDPIPIPRAHRLFQNYPNPFNPSTSIRYGLPSRSQVTLTVFNTLGQEVAQLLNGEQDAGYHEVKFDASGMSSGVYFYKMHAGSFTETKKLLLVH